MDELRTMAADGALHIRSEESREIDIRLVTWGELGRTNEGPERFRRGAFRGTDPSRVTLEAIGAHAAEPGVRLAGRGVAIDEREDAAYLTVRASKVSAGDELLELVRDGVYRSASIVFAEVPGGSARGRDGVTERTRVDLRRVGIVERGAYPSAEVLAVREEGPMASKETNPPTEPEPEPEPTPTGTRIVADSPEMAGRLEALRTDLLGRMASLEAGGGASRGVHPLARWASLGEYLADASGDPDAAVLLGRALVDQITTDNPGVMPPTFLTEVQGIIGVNRPAIAALGGARSLGDSGMSLHYPYYDGDLSTLVAKQATEKTEIHSVKVSLKDGQAAIETFAGGSDVSYQLIRRSRPAYLESYGRIMLAGWALTTEKEFESDLLAGATGSIVFIPGGTDAELRAAFFAASAKVRAATGSPATVALAASDVFGEIGGALTPPAYGTANVTGTGQASTLRVNVSGLEVVEAPYLPAGSILWTNESAAGWHEDGPMVATAEDVARLGQNRAYWSMGATGIYIPAGIVKAVAVTARQSASK